MHACSIGVRGHFKEYNNPKKTRYLLGNIFLKNFYSIYDFDKQTMGFGVNIHSQGLAQIKEYKSSSWANEAGYVRVPEVWQRVRKGYWEDWQAQTGTSWIIDVKVGQTNGDLPQEQINFKPHKREDAMMSDAKWRPNPEQTRPSSPKKGSGEGAGGGGAGRGKKGKGKKGGKPEGKRVKGGGMKDDVKGEEEGGEEEGV